MKYIILSLMLSVSTLTFAEVTKHEFGNWRVTVPTVNEPVYRIMTKDTNNRDMVLEYHTQTGQLAYISWWYPIEKLKYKTNGVKYALFKFDNAASNKMLVYAESVNITGLIYFTDDIETISAWESLLSGAVQFKLRVPKTNGGYIDSIFHLDGFASALEFVKRDFAENYSF